METSTLQPILLVPQNSKLITQWEQAFAYYESPEVHTFSIDVHEDLVKRKQVNMIQEMISALQHYPHLIEKMIFSLEFKFTEVEDSDLYIPENCWKFDNNYYTWFSELSKLPIMIFFINDADARYYALLGDMLANGSLPVTTIENNERSEISLEGVEWKKFVERLFNSCWMMLLYCHNTGFNPEPYIQSLLADMDVSGLWDDIYKKYQEDVRKDVRFRSISKAA